MNPLTIVHIAGGSVALLAGAVALTARKGGRLHARAGTWFFGGMLVLTLTGAAIAAVAPERGTTVVGLLTAYLVTTSWMTARRRDGEAGRFAYAAFAFALACCIAQTIFALQAAAAPNGRLDSLPAAAHYPFAMLAGLAAALDLNFLLRGPLSGRQRIARHLWRMCAALVIAAFSFFLGQQDEFPKAWQGSPLWFAPPLAALGALIFWSVRVRIGKRFAAYGPRRAPA